MTDAEMVRRCAERMGYTIVSSREPSEEYDVPGAVCVKQLDCIYWPLTDDAQCFALMRGLHMDISAVQNAGGEPYGWSVFCRGYHAENTDLNRAVVECVARMEGE